MKRKKTNKSPLKIILLLLNYVAALALLLSYLAPYTNPHKYWIIAFAGLAYPLLLITNVFFILIWLIRFDKYFLISLICILAAWNYPSKIYQIKGIPASQNEASFKVMSYNVHFFDQYGKSSKSDNLNKEIILDYVIDNKPDIICIQEYYNQAGTADFNSQLKEAGSIYHKSFFPYASSMKNTGMAILSRFPIINSMQIEDIERNRLYAMAVDVLINEDTIRIYNIHLQSIRLGDEEYIFDKLPIIQGAEKTEEIKAQGKQLIGKLKYAFEKRSNQVHVIENNILECQFPYIICGDLNDTPISYTYRKLKRNAFDAFVISGKGTGQTYAGNYPSFRIDYIFHSKHLTSSGFTTGDILASDHYPIFTEITPNSITHDE